MNEKERGRLSRDIGYEAASIAMGAIESKCAGDAGVFYAAQSWAAYMLGAMRDADLLLNNYHGAVIKTIEDVDE